MADEPHGLIARSDNTDTHMPDWSLESWVSIVSTAFTILAFLFLFSPFRRYIGQFNDWYDAKDKERTIRRLAFMREQLKDIVEGTSHLHFQRSVSGGLLALTLALLLIFISLVYRRGDAGSAIILVFMAFGAAIWQFGSAFRRMNGIREDELRERILKLEKQVRRFNLRD